MVYGERARPADPSVASGGGQRCHGGPSHCGWHRLHPALPSCSLRFDISGPAEANKYCFGGALLLCMCTTRVFCCSSSFPACIWLLVQDSLTLHHFCGSPTLQLPIFCVQLCTSGPEMLQSSTQLPTVRRTSRW